MQWETSLFSAAQVLLPLTFLSWYSSFSCIYRTLLQQSPNTYLWLVPEPLKAGFSCYSFSLASCEVLVNISWSPMNSLSIASTNYCVVSSIAWLMMESSVNLVCRSLLSFLPSLSCSLSHCLWYLIYSKVASRSFRGSATLWRILSFWEVFHIYPFLFIWVRTFITKEIEICIFQPS